MNGHISNRILTGCLHSAYQTAKLERDRPDHSTPELVAYWQGRMDAAKTTAITLGLIKSVEEFENDR